MVKGNIEFDTPDGKKRVVTAGLTPPRPKSATAVRSLASKENEALLLTPARNKAGEPKQLGLAREEEDEPSFRPPRAQAVAPRVAFEEVAPMPGTPQNLSFSAERSSETALTSSIVQSALPDAKPQAANAEMLFFRRSKSSGAIAGKIGTSEIGGAKQVAADIARIREDTEARAGTIRERQQFDSVGLLLGGQGRVNVVGVLAPEDCFQEVRAGRFYVRNQQAHDQYEVHVYLPGGRLTKVSRNPLRRTLTFEGKAISRWQASPQEEDERLVVRVPSGYDLSAEPAEVVKNFSEGRCFIALARNVNGFSAGAASMDEKEV